ncbi:CidA/LrgA family protein [Ectothiorhodospiraceae bacterium WFHF3C12]|nr:CidA/LrgA family protein [Ectothiorhodospiraceae bacterium WFHF3C12]
MLEALMLLLGCQLLGEVLAGLLALPVPGPVIGLVLLFAVLAIRGGVGDGVGELANALLRHLSLLFVPAGVGIMRHMDRVAADWLPIAATLVGSTLLTLAVTAAVMRALTRESR